MIDAFACWLIGALMLGVPLGAMLSNEQKKRASAEALIAALKDTVKTLQHEIAEGNP